MKILNFCEKICEKYLPMILHQILGSKQSFEQNVPHFSVFLLLAARLLELRIFPLNRILSDFSIFGFE